MDNYTAEIKDIIANKEQNLKLMDALIASLMWVIHYTEKNNIPLPDIEGLHYLLKESIKLMERSYLTLPSKKNHPQINTQNEPRTDETEPFTPSTDPLQDKDSTDNLTEPKGEI